MNKKIVLRSMKVLYVITYIAKIERRLKPNTIKKTTINYNQHF